MRLRTALMAATMLALPVGAQAQLVNGLYVAAGAGWNWQDNQTIDISSALSPSLPAGFYQQRTDMNTGWVIVGSVGWGFGNGLRAELEGSYRQNDVNRNDVSLLGIPLPVASSSGTISTTAVMANVFYDFRLGPVMPYVGAGIGYAWANYDNIGYSAAWPYGVRGRDSGFAWQLIAGVALPIRQVPGLAITAEYRYFATDDMSVRTAIVIPNGGPVINMGTTSLSNVNQSLLIGVRYNFGRAPAAPPPVAAPAPARSFIVFFDFNRHDLTARAREIIAQAAAAARSQQVTRIEVAGHTDTVGSAQYNLGLSQRRANSVAAELVRLGVPREAIQTAGYGFSRPLVPTGPNVREPQNRRVEIVFR